MILCPITRSQLLTLMPRNGHVAEVGVAEGAFSEEIVRLCEPHRLTLIDPWEWQAREDYQNDANNADAQEQQRRFEQVSGQFADDPRVTILRAYSTDAASTFADRQLDFVYIDALHTYDAVLADLRAFFPKVADDGLILGHDFANHPMAQQMKFGVIEAVETFLAESGCRMIALTNEIYPTFVLAKNPDGPTAQRLLAAICYAVPNPVEIDAPPTRFRQRVIEVADRIRVINGFTLD
ncbi:MAG: class I SAM-dependent methyltransferase [Alphaproteobacteria bacterium]|nr:class I SAM-dependent methyltransferase [Alphaproteobacteria bacterium]